MTSVECLFDGDVVVNEELNQDDAALHRILQKRGEETRERRLPNVRLQPRSSSPSSCSNSVPSALPEQFVLEHNEEAELSWRLHPEISMSDWKIEVATPGRAIMDIYHVHKTALAVGPRRSGYLASAIQHRKTYGKTYTLMQYSPSSVSSAVFSTPKSMLSTPIRDNSSRALPRESPMVSLLCVRGSQEQQHQVIRSVPSVSSIIEDDDDDDVVNTTRLELEPLAAEAFPVVLDYMYDVSGNLQITTENATALFVLANRLEIKALRGIVEEFWRADLKINTVVTYYKHARTFNDKQILQALEVFCANRLFEVKDNCIVDILEAADPFFLLNIVSAAFDKHGTNEFSLRLSLIIAVYCNLHKDELNESVYLRLTAAHHLPVIEAKAAIAFLEMQELICGATSHLSSLTERCIAVLSENWDSSCVSDLRSSGEATSERDAVCLPCLSGDAMEEFVRLSFVHAKKKVLQLEAEKDAAERRIQELQQQLDMKKLGELATLQTTVSKTNVSELIECESNVSGNESEELDAISEESIASTHDSTSDESSSDEEPNNAKAVPPCVGEPDKLEKGMSSDVPEQAPAASQSARHEAWV